MSTILRIITKPPYNLGQMKLAPILLPSLSFVALLAIGCGGGGGGTSSTVHLPTFIPGSVSDADFTAADTTLGTLATQLDGQTDAASVIVAKMKTMKQFAAAQVSASGDAEGWMTDGEIYIVNTSDPDSTGVAGPASVAPAAKTVKPFEIPGAPTAYLIDAMEAARWDPTATIAPGLTKAGYNVVKLSGSIANFLSISNAGLVVLNCHGSNDEDQKGVPTFYLSTSDVVTNPLRHTYDSQLSTGTIAVVKEKVYQNSSHSDFAWIAKFVVSPNYLHQSGVSFAKNSMLLNMACWSNSPLITSQMVGSNGFPGLSVYAGWTLPSLTKYASQSVEFAVDRLLGLDMQPPVDPTNPPPSTWKALVSTLATTQRPDQPWALDTSILSAATGFPGATTKWIFSSSASSKLETIIPSITGADADTPTQTLQIDGSFGSSQGSVLLDGNYLTIKTWSDQSITTDLPSAGGTLVVHSANLGVDGYLLSNSYDYVVLKVGITPNTFVDIGKQQVFTAVATSGALPSNVSYRWSLSGLGSLLGGSPITTKTPNVTYQAPQQSTSDTLTLAVLNSSGNQIATTTYTILVGPSMQAQLTLSGFPNGQGINNGTVTFSGGQGGRALSTEPGLAPPGAEILELDFGPPNPNANPPFTILMALNPGEAVQTNHRYPVTSQGAATTVALDSVDFELGVPMSGPITSGVALGGTGSVTFTNIVDEGGTYTAAFTVTDTGIGSGSTGTVNGKGVAVWKHL